MSEYSNYRRPSESQRGSFSSRDYYKDNLRVLRKNLVFCSGLPLQLTESQLKSHGYFGKYGKVTKVTMLRNVRQMSVYLTYSDPYEASLAIIATNDFQLDRYHKLASIYGTIKYCKYFLKRIQCKNLPNCNYLHVFDKKNQIYINNQLPDEVFDEHYSIAMQLLCEVNVKQMIMEKRLKENTTSEDVLPCPIETLNRILKDNRGSEEYKGFYSEEEYSENVSECSGTESDKSESEEETYETITAQTLELNQNKKEEFPPLSGLQTSKREKYREKLKQSQNNRQKQMSNQKQKQRQISSQKQKQKRKLILLSPPKALQRKQSHTSNTSQSLQLNSQSLQIKLIRRLLRQPRSKLNNWTQLDNHAEQEQQINFFHKELSQLNELRQLCESNILKQINKQQERVKFLLIKNIHHRKHHHIHHYAHHAKKDQNVVL